MRYQGRIKRWLVRRGLLGVIRKLGWAPYEDVVRVRAERDMNIQIRNEMEDRYMSKHKPGIRVGAISHTEGDTVYLFGWGVYEGDHAAEEGTIGVFGLDAAQLGTNPRIRLDSGDVVWGCQCWWAPEAEIRERIGNMKLVTVPVPTRTTEGEG